MQILALADVTVTMGGHCALAVKPAKRKIFNERIRINVEFSLPSSRNIRFMSSRFGVK